MNESLSRPPKAQKRILVYRIGHIGDTVVALPALWAIRKHFPNAHITLLSNAQLKSHYALASQVLPSHGLIDDSLTYVSNDNGSSPFKLLQLLPRLRSLQFDTLVYLAPRLRLRRHVLRDLLYFRVAGIKKFIGHHGFSAVPGRKSGEPLPVLEHEADHLLARLARSGVSVPRPGDAQMDLALDEYERKSVFNWLQERIPDFPTRVTLVGVGPGSKWASKVWPENRFAALGHHLVHQLKLYPIVFGGSEDGGLGERLTKAWGAGINAAGGLNIRQTAAALSHCSLYVGNDTGSMHLAAAVGTPCVVAMSAQDWPGRWHPYGFGHTVLRANVPCEGCLLKDCEKEQLRCLKEISVEAALNACRQVLQTAFSGELSR